MRTTLRVVLVVFLASALNAHAFLEDLCLPRVGANGRLTWCLTPKCVNPPPPSRACPEQIADFATIMPGRSMIHHDSTHFIAQAIGLRADVAYWIAAYNEVADYTQYVPIDQCGVQAANDYTIQNGNTLQTAVNTGRDFITAQFNGFQRTNVATDGPLDHYVVSYSPNGQGTDVHGPAGVSSLYPLHYPKPGYPVRIDDTYQKTLANLRQWGMLKTADPGLLCTVGLTVTDSYGKSTCLTGTNIVGTVPLIMQTQASPISINAAAGRKILQLTTDANGVVTDTVYYEQLGPWLQDPKRTTGKLWKSNPPVPVPVQLARFGLYLHVLQDTSSHATYCGDDPPSPPNGGDPGTFMYTAADGTIQLSFGNSCAMSPHLAGHVQETGTGDAALPLRDYVALNNTVDELILFANEVAKHQPGWVVNPELLPPDVVGGKNARGQSAADLKTVLVGKIVSGQPYSMVEQYQSGVVTRPLQIPHSQERLHAMNLALAQYNDTVKPKVRFEHLPGNSADPKDTRVCWKPVNSSAR